MSNVDHSANVFATPDFWRSPKRLKLVASPDDDEIGSFHLDLNGDYNPPPLSLLLPDDGIFKLPASLEHLPPQSILSQPESISEPEEQSDIRFEDIWLPLSHEPKDEPQLRTWETFYAGDATPESSRNPVFISEAGPVVYDQLLFTGAISSLAGPGQDYTALDPSHFLSCLVSLALGRGSLLFSWDPQKRAFRQDLKDVRLSGFSTEVLGGVTSVCMECGNDTRFLRNFIEKSYASHASPCRVALANFLDRLLCAVQSRLEARVHSFRSLIQMQAGVYPLRSTTQYFKRLISKVSRSTTDEKLLSLLFEAAHTAEFGDEFLRVITRDILQAVSRPWLEFAEEWAGLRRETGIPISKEGRGKGFITVDRLLYGGNTEHELEDTDYFLKEENVPSFFPDDVAKLLFETGKNLRFIWSYHDDHPLSRPQTLGESQAPGLDWMFRWEDITRLELEVLAYEQRLSDTVNKIKSLSYGQHCTSNGTSLQSSCTISLELDCFGEPEQIIEERILASIAQLDGPAVLPPVVSGHTLDALESLFSGRLDGDPMPVESFAPHWSLIPRLSFGPVIQAQARIVNTECMRLLFDAHNLRDHLDAQFEFHLFGSGIFCSRLSHALFDPELDTAERKRGVALSGGTMGLRLVGRDTWPPASSELRLALMGVIKESRDPPGRHDLDPLPGDMSFSIRELSNEEMEKCMDPNSLEALDFLRLTYKPPAPLAPIITHAALDRYDRIFRLLLRMLRMLFVSNQLFRGHAGQPSSDPVEHRFRFEARHFVSTIAAHFFGEGVAGPWRRFVEWLDHVEFTVCAGRADADGHKIPARAVDVLGPEQLRGRHDELLSEIMSALLLRKHQEPVLRLLNDIFTLILRFAGSDGRSCRGQEAGGHLNKTSLYWEFRRKVEVFMTVCKGLAEKSADAKSKAGSIAQLVLVLDMSGFYSKHS
ncbi:hypothetical protein PpBr36_01774 [Pyricularia pennisetigena]|uniref:hypothetical protein n=1 Tax=Pyricularia pennisetigena TaxID=1578925 RepID=UPI0011541924|nr:hypothetical protein PpBr36_01774 [Pyricularia pennisetigena]TLS28970.1 hypothetical protein PpBr36_01774 [Pyricularia pennisetigena]